MIIGLIYLGGWVLVAGVGVLASLGIMELNQMLKVKGIPFYRWLAILWTWGVVVSAGFHEVSLLVLVSGLAIASAVSMFLRKPDSFQGSLTTTWATLYVGLFFAFLILIRQMPNGKHLDIGFFLVIWATDSMAFFTGKFRGRHKLLPHVSPAKTWEGAIGGTISGTLVAILLAILYHYGMANGAIFGFVISIAGQIGDLLESHIKRFSGVKDSGTLLPGHGGVLDRFDSALFSLPFAYYLLRSLGIS